MIMGLRAESRVVMATMGFPRPIGAKSTVPPSSRVRGRQPEISPRSQNVLI